MTRIEGRRTLLVALVSGALAFPAAGQQSAGFHITDQTFNAGGHPRDGVASQSTSFRITLDAIGDGVVRSGLSSNSYRMDAGFGSTYGPPGEVAARCGIADGPCLVFTDGQTLVWPAERSADRYDVYRDESENGFGSCELLSVVTTATTDTTSPTTAGRFFYLVTAKNRLGEEGPKGFGSNGVERLGALELPVCP